MHCKFPVLQRKIEALMGLIQCFGPLVSYLPPPIKFYLTLYHFHLLFPSAIEKSNIFQYARKAVEPPQLALNPDELVDDSSQAAVIGLFLRARKCLK
jgi:hypothetical protein